MTLSWMTTARSLLGTKEVPGDKNNPNIVSWASTVGGYIAKSYKSDSIPWCGLFTAYCFTKNGFAVRPSALSSLDWLNWGVKLAAPSYGAIMVFVRPGGGHVGFYVSEDKDTYHILGGNQSDSVSVTRVAKGRLKGIRWPAGVDKPTDGPVIATFTGKISTNEA